MSTLNLDPRLVLASPWLWDAETIAWAEGRVRQLDADQLEQEPQPAAKEG